MNLRLATELRGMLSIQRPSGAEAVAETFARLVRNQVLADVAIIAAVGG